MFAEPFLRQHYDAILCHFGGNGMDFIALKDLFPNTRFVTMFHGDDYFIGDEKGPEAFALLKRFGDAFLVTTDCFGRATLRRYGFGDQRIVTLRLSIDTKEISFRERHRTGNTVRLLSVGRLVQNGLEFGVRAAAALQAANPKLQIDYSVIGGGPIRDDLASSLRSSGQPRRCVSSRQGRALKSCNGCTTQMSIFFRVSWNRPAMSSSKPRSLVFQWLRPE
jgi:glycosyltransferase involved in cell wall biosynthesis